MDVQLKPDIQRFVEDQVKVGRYHSVDEAINEAVSRLRVENDLLNQDLDDDDVAAIEEGLAQLNRGEGRSWESARADLRDRHLPE